MVHELDLCDTNHAIEILCEKQTTAEERETKNDYIWSRTDGIKSMNERAKEINETMQKAAEK